MCRLSYGNSGLFSGVCRLSGELCRLSGEFSGFPYISYISYCGLPTRPLRAGAPALQLRKTLILPVKTLQNLTSEGKNGEETARNELSGAGLGINSPGVHIRKTERITDILRVFGRIRRGDLCKEGAVLKARTMRF
jgi:hypothetical protein